MLGGPKVLAFESSSASSKATFTMTVSLESSSRVVPEEILGATPHPIDKTVAIGWIKTLKIFAIIQNFWVKTLAALSIFTTIQNLWALAAFSPVKICKDAFGDAASTFQQLKEIGCNDKRKVIHSMKVAITLSIAAFYVMFSQNFTDEFVGHNGIWAIMTVVVMYEFTAGATLSKGLNRGLGTFLAGVLVLGMSQLAVVCGKTGQQILICLSIFFVGISATFLRFVPKVKARYDYGVLVFLLTFSLLMISTSSNGQPLQIALSRLFMIFVGCCISLTTSTLIYPIWAGDELHNSIAKNFKNLAESLEGSVHQYLHSTYSKAKHQVDDDPIYKTYRALFTSTTSEESMANFATWEPPHGPFKMLKYPWNKYVQVGAALRHCAYTGMALHGCLTSEVQAPHDLRIKFAEELEAVSTAASEVLYELGNNLRNMQRNRPKDQMLSKVNLVAEELQMLLDKQSTQFVTVNVWWSSSTRSPPKRHTADTYKVPHSAPLDTLYNAGSEDPYKVPHSAPLAMCNPHTLSMESIQSASNFSLATFISLLIETVVRIEHVVEVVDQLGDVANFKAASKEEACHHVINMIHCQ